MFRRNFILEPPYREIHFEDKSKQFKNELFPQKDVLADLVTMNTGNVHVFVYDQDGEILAFLMFYDYKTYFHIEFVATNRLFPSQSAGTKLIKLLEGIGKELNYSHIQLDSLEQKIPYYKALGYVDTGIPMVGNYDKTTRMIKSLT